MPCIASCENIRWQSFVHVFLIRCLVVALREPCEIVCRILAVICNRYFESVPVMCWIIGNEEYPTLLHFTAKHGLEKLSWQLIESPGGEQACQIRNSSHLTPAEIAEKANHVKLSNALKGYMVSSLFILPRHSVPTEPLFTSVRDEEFIKLVKYQIRLHSSLSVHLFFVTANDGTLQCLQLFERHVGKGKA